MKNILFILGALWLVGCETDAKVDLPTISSKLVVTSFISPQDTVLKVQVSESSPVFSKSPQQRNEIKNANVVLSDGTQSIKLDFTPGIGSLSALYTASAIQFPIKAGQTYFLTVSLADGRQVKASCLVPSRIGKDVITRIEPTTIQRYSGTQKGYSLAMDWQDTPGEGDYYRAYAEGITNYSLQSTSNGHYEVIDTIYSPIYFQRGSEYVQDRNQDARWFSVKEGKFAPTDWVVPQPGDTFRIKRQINVYVLTTDRNYYLYQRWLENDTSDNPFADPALTYTNMEGGLGVFAAYQRFKKVISY